MVGPILKGEDWTFTPIDIGLGEYFFEKAKKCGNEIFQIEGDSGNEQTYKETSEQATRIAVYLKSLGIKQKDVVLLCCNNSQYEMAAILAALYLGAYVSAVDAGGSILETKYLINLVEPKAIFVPDDRIELIEQSITELPNKPIIIAIGDTKGKYTDMLQIKKTDEENNFRPVPQKGSDTCAILFSSGSTSSPKGICMSNSTVLNGALALSQYKFINSGSILYFAKMNGVTAWAAVGSAIATGSSKISTAKFNGEHFFKLIHKYKVKVLLTTNPLVYLLTALDEETVKKYDTSSLFLLGLGGSALDPNAILKLRKYLPHTNVNLCYASSEMHAVAAHDFSKTREAREKVSSSGTAVPGVQIKVVDLDTEKLLGPNERGEIRVLSKNITKGIYKLSNENFLDQDGWYKTGDEGYYDEDGYIYITDRISSMFKYIGSACYQISPTLLEFAILQHPKVFEAVAFGVPHEVDINHPAACIILKPDVTATVEEIIEFVDSKVSDGYRLRGGLMILDEIPKLSSGKYDRRLVKENFIKMKQLNVI